MTVRYKNLWMVEDGVDAEGQPRAFWTKVGVGFENRDGSFSLELSAVPVSGRLQMRDPKPKLADASGGMGVAA